MSHFGRGGAWCDALCLIGAKTAAGLATSCRLHRGRLAPGCSRVHMHPPQIKRQRYHHVHSVMGRRCWALAPVSRCLDGDRLICCSDSAVGSSLVPGQRNSQQTPIDLRVTRAADTTLSDPNWAPAAAVPLRWPRSPWQQHRPGTSAASTGTMPDIWGVATAGSTPSP